MLLLKLAALFTKFPPHYSIYGTLAAPNASSVITSEHLPRPGGHFYSPGETFRAETQTFSGFDCTTRAATWDTWCGEDLVLQTGGIERCCLCRFGFYYGRILDISY